MKNRNHSLLSLCMSMLLLVMTQALPAQDPVFELTISAPGDVYYNPGSPTASGFIASYILQETQTSGGGTGAVAEVSGYSLGVAHDSTLLAVDSFLVTSVSTTGIYPDFDQEGIYADGFTMGVVFCFTGCWVLNYDVPAPLIEVGYQLLDGPLGTASAATTTILETSENLGQPPVTNVAVVNSASIPMQGVPAQVNLIPFVPEFQLSLETLSTVYYSEANPASEAFSADVMLQEVLLPGGGTGEYSEVQGASYGVGHDDALMQITGVTSQVSALDGTLADFDEIEILANGMTHGLVFSFLGSWSLSYETADALSTIDYQLLSGSLTGSSTPTATTLEFTDTLGDPPVDLAVVTDGASNAPTVFNSSLDLVPFTGSRFIRGDATQDANLDLADGIGVLSYLFLGEPTTCLKAMDMDQSNHVSISDGVQVLCSLFCPGSPAPSGPYPDCGVDLNSTLTCESFNACP